MCIGSYLHFAARMIWLMILLQRNYFSHRDQSFFCVNTFSILSRYRRLNSKFINIFIPNLNQKKKKTIQSIVTEIRWLFLSIIFQKSACHTIGWICDSATVVLSLRCASSPTPQQNRNECVPNEYEPVTSEWNKIQMESMVLCHSLLDPQQQRKR